MNYHLQVVRGAGKSVEVLASYAWPKWPLVDVFVEDWPGLPAGTRVRWVAA